MGETIFNTYMWERTYIQNYTELQINKDKGNPIIIIIFYFKQEVYLNNKMLGLKEKLSKMHFFLSLLKGRLAMCNSYIQKSHKIVLGFTMVNEKH